MEESTGYEPLPGSHQADVPGARETGPADARQEIQVLIKLRRKQALPDLPLAKPLSREQLAEEYGASQADIDAVVQTYTRLGLKNTDTDAATRTVQFSGTVGEMEKAFGVRLFDYTHPGGDYRGRTGYIYIPRQLSTIVETVFGLDNPPIKHRTV